MILADTSAWICSFKRAGYEAIKAVLRTALETDTLAIAGIIKLELLQGTKTPKEYRALERNLSVLHRLPVTEDIWQHAAEMGFDLRRRGLTIPATDLLVAALSIQYECTLLHYDRHFEQILDHHPLRLYGPSSP